MSDAIRETSVVNKKMFTRPVRGILTPYKFYISYFPGNEDIRRAVRRGGGIVVLLKDIETADFYINTRGSNLNNSHGLPVCHPRFITQSMQAGKLLDYNDYLIGSAKSNRQHINKPTAQSSPIRPEDDVIVDVRRLYGDSDMDAEDCLVDSFLSSQSRSISEYKARAPESPSAHSTNSVDISDSDYRIKQVLDRSAVDVRDMPAPSSPLAREVATSPTGEPHFDPSSPSSAERKRRAEARMARVVSETNNKPRFAAAEERGRQNARLDSSEGSGSAAGPSNASGNGVRGLSSSAAITRHSNPTRNTLSRKQVSPELEVPSPNTPMTSEFVFIERSGVAGTPQKSTGNRASRAGNAEPHLDHDADFADTSEDEHYPDPLSFLAARSPNPRTTSPLQGGSGRQEAGATSPELTSGTPVRGAGSTDIDRVNSDTGRVAESARQAQRRMSWRGLRKRRRTSSNETGYGEQPVPVIVDRRALPVSSSAGLTKQQLSQPSLEDRPIAALRSRSVDEVMATGQEQPGTDTRLWSASKRIRMSVVDSSNDSGDSNSNANLQHTEVGTVTPNTASVLKPADKSAIPPSEISSQPPRSRNGSVSGALQSDGHAPAAIVLADESSSYPTTNSSAPQALSVDDPGHIVHVSQTPDALSQEAPVVSEGHGVGVLSPLSPSSSQLTEPIPDEANDTVVAAAETATQPASVAENEQSGSPDGDNISQEQTPGDMQIERSESSQAFGESYVDQSPEAVGSSNKNAEDDDIEFNITEPAAISQTNPVSEPTPVQPESQGDADRTNDSAFSIIGADSDGDSDDALANLVGSTVANGEQTTPQRQMSTRQEQQRTVAATENIHRTSARLDIPKRRSLGPDTTRYPQTGRQRKSSASRRLTMCQRLQQLNKLSTSNGRLGIQMDPALAPPARLLVSGLHGDTLNVDPISTPSTPSRRATFSGAMRVLGECDPVVTDTDRLRYMCKLKGLIEGTELSPREALQTLYFFTGDWVSARRYIVLGKESLTEDCMWSAKEDEVLLQGLVSKKMEELRERKGNVEVYRRLQFLNTFHSTRLH
ncbi:hypothetical protein H4R20_001256 [Coemansia guatemalensis]|uniref:BRCT domain-containing protein n=1 Tax=Coemansia guatemalensis TaxID=2761395 RepID=A0A9W8LV34_9FUNG|nr:hypothetical protein H4R20_001256 [Coemansia guatemalensis]